MLCIWANCYEYVLPFLAPVRKLKSHKSCLCMRSPHTLALLLTTMKTRSQATHLSLHFRSWQAPALFPLQYFCPWVRNIFISFLFVCGIILGSGGMGRAKLPQNIIFLSVWNMFCVHQKRYFIVRRGVEGGASNTASLSENVHRGNLFLLSAGQLLQGTPSWQSVP